MIFTSQEDEKRNNSRTLRGYQGLVKGGGLDDETVNKGRVREILGGE